MHRLFLNNLSSDQHLILFSPQRERNVDPRLRQFHLVTCLRSTAQLARFANSYHARQLKDFTVVPAVPSKTFYGESLDIRWADESTSNKISGETDFLQKSFAAICELVGEPSLDFAVVPLLRKESLQNLVDKFKKEYRCDVDPMLCDNEQNKILSSSGNEMPRIQFFHPYTIEGCEFSKILILLENQNSFFLFDDNHFFTAFTRASLKVLVVVSECSIPDESWWEDNFSKFVRSMVDKTITEIPPDSNQQSVMFVGPIKRLIESLGCHQSINEKETVLPSILGVSIYERHQRKFLQADDVYLESDFENLLDFGVQKIVLADDNVTSIWQYYFLTISHWCCIIFSRENNNCFEIEDFYKNVDEMKFQMDFRMAFMRRISGDDAVSFPDNWLNLDVKSLPSSGSLSWENCVAKAEEVHRKGFTAQAIIIYECGIKILEQNSERDASHTQKLAELSTRVSRIYMKSKSSIVKESRCTYWVPTTQYEECLLKAFRHAATAIKWNFPDSIEFDLIHEIVKEIKEYPKSETFQKELSQLVRDDIAGMMFDNRLRHGSELQIPLESRFGAKLCDLETLIRDYEKGNFREGSPETMRENISKLARELFQKEVCSLSEPPVQNDKTIVGQFQEDFHKMMMQLDYPVQLAMVAVHWNHACKDNIKDLSIALGELERYVNKVENHVLEVKQEATHSTKTETQATQSFDVLKHSSFFDKHLSINEH